MTTHALPDEPHLHRQHSAKPTLTQRLARSALGQRLDGLRDGRLRLMEAQGAIDIGTPGELDASLRVLDPAFYTRIARSGLIGTWTGKVSMVVIFMEVVHNWC